ncbi:MAG: ribonuclease HII [Methanomassiliicoccales archaeon]|nr:ribonuclease HII [Methanomassiliicoccales archaeon]
MLCGVDEAGRGPVLGPLVVAAVLVENDAELIEMEVRDSKRLTPKRREELAPRIRRCSKVACEIVSSTRVDEWTVGHRLNQLEAAVFAKLIDELEPDVAYVDACDANEMRFASMLRRNLVHRPRLVCKHKADDIYPVVSAASIIAKTVRDAEIRKIEEAVGEPIGTGYAHDETTRAFLEKWIREKQGLPPQTRASWATTRKAESLARNSRLTDWKDGERE